MEANIIMQKCSKSTKTFGVRVQLMNDGDWWRTWSFPMKKTQAKSEGFDKNSVKGNMYATEEYPGCPYCGTFGFVQCNTCHKITCWNSESSIVCKWCSNKMGNIVIATDKFDIFGGKL